MMMSPFDPAASPSAESDRSRSLLHHPRRREKQWRKSSATMGPVVLALLPVVLSLIYLARALYCCPTGVHASGDAQLYVYQLTRIGEVNGRWWELGTDPLVGHPYQSSAAKMPGIYEGLDLLLLSMLTSRFVDPVLNYCLAVLAVLVVNGWIAGLLTYRLTRSYPWAVLAVVLITLNLSTALRVSGHLHLFKYGWILLSVWAFLRYLETPSLKRGIQLGLATVVVLQSSFYLGYLLALGLGLCWLLELIAGRITRRHASAAATAAATVALLGPLVTYPVWAVAPRAALSDSYFVRSIKDLWLYGADLVQYIFPYLAKTEIIFLKARYGGFFEGWNYLGVVALGTFALGALGWLRGRRLELRERRSVHLLLVLIGLFVLLSLSGGPSILLYQLFPSFRCYGRAGLLALALTCVATPAILQGLLARIRSDSRRRLLYLAVLGLALLDGGAQFYRVSKHWRQPGATEEPWVAWLARQPETVRLVAFSDFDPHAPGQIVDRWNWGGLYWRIYHRHATLNGGEFELLNRDLKRFGASYERMNEPGLRFVASLGYNRLAFQKGYLEANPWITSLPWMRRVETIGDWSIYGTLPATGISPGESEPSN